MLKFFFADFPAARTAFVFRPFGTAEISGAVWYMGGFQSMRILWDSFSDDEKPEWTSLEEIERFSKKMLEEEIY